MPENMRILLVDDEISLLKTYSKMLEDFDYYVKTASTKDDALRLVSEETFDIAFLDQFLGPTKGLDLMQMISEIDPELYFVIITGNATHDLAVEAMKKGASDFIGKPFFVADLIKSIDYVTRRMELNRQKKNLMSTLELKVNEREKELRNIYFSVLSALAQAMEKKDTGTYGHSRRVSYNSRLIAAALDLGEEDRENLMAASLLHDIGKIGTSDFILGKPGFLNEEEMHAVRSHPLKGVEILKPLKKTFRQFEAILPAILHHHESYDGSGYPAGLSGENIPLLARIITVADTYDAILSNRPYRAAADHNKAFKELSVNAGTQFDKKIVDAFIDTHTKYNKLFKIY